MKIKIKSTLLLVTTAVIWGFAFVAQRVGAEYVGAFTFNGIRFLLGGVSLIPVILIFEREKFDKDKMKTTVLVGLLAGVILFIAAWLQQLGIEITHSAGKAGFLTGLYTVLVPLIRFLAGKKTSVSAFIGAVFALGGLFLLCMTDNELKFGTGDIILIVGAVFWALHIIVIDKYVGSMSPLKFSMTQFLVCGILSMAFALFTEDIQLFAVKQAAAPILYGGLMSVGVAYTCQTLGQKDADPTFAAIILSAESVFGAFGGVIILHEVMSSRSYFGCALIFVGIILSQLDFSALRQKLNKNSV